MRGRAADRPASVSGPSPFTRCRTAFGDVESPAHGLQSRVTSCYAGGVSGAGESVAIRLATTADAVAIVEIYNREVMQTTATFDLVPRTIEQQQEWLAARSGAFAAIVAVDEARRVVGFASLSPYKERAAYRTTVEDSVYVHQDFTGPRYRQGVARTARRGRPRVGVPLDDRTDRGQRRRVAGAPRQLWIRARRHRARGRPQVQPLAVRRRHAADALARKTTTTPPPVGSSASWLLVVGREGFEPP